MNDEHLREVYEAVDAIPFTRSKRNIGRDFSDGVMMAELVHYFQPKMVALHNYPAANSFSQKQNNWNTLNNKVLKKLGLPLGKAQIENIINAVPLAIQSYLHQVITKLEYPERQISLMKPRSHEQTNQNKNLTPKSMQSSRSPIPSQNVTSESDETLQLIEQIEDAYAQLQKLQEASKLRDEMIRNLEKKLDKMIFS